MISKLHVAGFRCLRNVDLALTPLHALIGPNDSGKSTLLEALRLACNWAGRAGGTVGGELPVGAAMTLHTSDGFYRAERDNDRWANRWESSDGRHTKSPPTTEEDFARLRSHFRGARLLRLDPDALRKPSALIPAGHGLELGDARGAGLPGIYQAILGRGDDSFAEIRTRAVALFPTLKTIRVEARTAKELVFGAELKDGTKVSAEELSEGLLYYLAFAAIPYLAPTSLLLVEEPENGLHPARIREVVRILRSIADGGTQVVMATHSPLVINELRPEEVTVVTRPSLDEGTRCTPIAATPGFATRAKVYALGELWLAYADGNVEAALLEEGEHASLARG